MYCGGLAPRAALAGALLACGCCLMLALVRPFWHDEASTWYFAGHGWDTLWAKLGGDVHPPLYFLLASGVFGLGAELMAMRVVSCLCAGAAAWVFLRHWAPPCRGRWGELLVAGAVGSSAFVAVAGYQARYYGLVMLLAMLTATALRRCSSGGPGAALVAGAGVGLIGLTNYPGGALIGMAAVGAVAVLAARRRIRVQTVLLFLAPIVLAGALVLPLFLHQYAAEVGGRVASGGWGATVRSAVLSLVYIVYAMPASDTLPPWTPTGLAVGAVGGVLALRGLLISLLMPERRWLAAGVMALTLAAALVAGVMLPGPHFLGAPWRFSWLIWPWLWLVLTPSRGSLPDWLPVLLLALHGAGLAGGLRGQATNWALQIPNEQIAREVEARLAGAAELKTIVYVNRAGMGAVARELEQRGVALNECAASTGARRLITIAGTSDLGWPPSEAMRLEPACDPAGVWRVTGEVFYLEDDPSTRALKARIIGRSVHQHKMVLRVWEPTEALPENRHDGP